jgi:hypothetical protein
MSPDRAVKRATYVAAEDPHFGERMNFQSNSHINIDKNLRNNERDFPQSTDTNANTQSDRKNREFNRKLRNDPNNIELWIEFLIFQDHEVKAKNNFRKLVERKISILKRAIEYNPTSTVLILMHLEFARQIDDVASLMKVWEDYLDKLPKCWELSREYLKTRQSMFLAYNFEQVNTEYASMFSKFKDSEHVLELYNLYVSFLKRSGYKERIVSISQALIEINIEYLNYGHVDIEGFEDQYDSSLMDHIGDSLVCKNTLINFLDPIKNTQDSVLRRWIDLERRRDFNCWHPFHFHFEQDDVISFEDFKPFLFVFKDDPLLAIKTILSAIARSFDFTVCFDDPRIIDISSVNGGLFLFYIEMFRSLSQFFYSDWRYFTCYFLCLHAFFDDKFDDLCKDILSNNREKFAIFLAYGRFQHIIGCFDLAHKVFASLEKITSKYSSIIEEFKDLPYEDCDAIRKLIPISESLNISQDDISGQVYELVRSNPGHKYLYMDIIDAVEKIDAKLAMEIFNLIDEQQLRLHVLLEEV